MTGKAKHILRLSKEEKQQLLDSFDIVISDCDGVLWTISMILPHTGTVVKLLKNHGKQFKFMSNNGAWSDQEFSKKIESIGLQIENTSDIIIPVKAIARHMKINHPDEQCHFLGSDIFYNTIRAKGVNVLNVTPPQNIDLHDLKKAVTATPGSGLLLIDTNINMTYLDFVKVHQYVLQKDSQVFVSAMDTRLSVGENFPIIGPGKFLSVLWENSDKKPIVFGKPSTIMGDYLVNEFDIKDRKRCLFVGDNLVADIQFASDQGFQTLFVLTGTHTKEEMLQKPLEDQPDYYADGLADFIEFFKDLERNEKKDK